MAFVKLDTKILNSTTWLDADACKVFITALLMAEPYEAREPIQSIQVRSTDPADFTVPVGWYGFVAAAGPGIAHRALIEQERALDALERLASPDPGSRTPDHDGRRMVRVPGGYLILNYMAHRDKDHSAAERQARLRARRKESASACHAVTVTPVTHADAHAHADTSKAKEKKEHASPSGSRLPKDWILPPEWCEWALAEKPGLNVWQEAASFADYWHAKAGKDGRKADWPATWRNWIRNSRNGNSNGTHRKLSAVERVRNGAIAGELADRAKSNGGAYLVGEDDRDLRSQVDERLR